MLRTQGKSNPIPGDPSHPESERASHPCTPPSLSYGRCGIGYSGKPLSGGWADRHRGDLQHLSAIGRTADALPRQKIWPVHQRRFRFSWSHQTEFGNGQRIWQPTRSGRHTPAAKNAPGTISVFKCGSQAAHSPRRQIKNTGKDIIIHGRDR